MVPPPPAPWVRLREDREVAQATQLADIQREEQQYRAAYRGSNQQLRGSGQREDTGNTVKKEAGTGNRGLGAGRGGKPFSKTD